MKIYTKTGDLGETSLFGGRGSVVGAVVGSIIMGMLNTPVFVDFMGSLDAAGTATAQLNSGPISNASSARRCTSPMP